MKEAPNSGEALQSRHPAVLEARRSWEKRRLGRRALLLLGGVGLVAASQTYHLSALSLVGALVVVFATVQTIRTGFGLLVTIGTHRLEMRAARRAFEPHERLTSDQQQRLRQREVDALMSREHARKARLLEVWRASKIRASWAAGASIFGVASFIKAWDMATSSDENTGYVMLLVLASVTCFIVAVGAMFLVLGSMKSANDEVAERRQLTREKEVLIHELEGEHLTGGLSVAADGQGLRGALTQDAAQGGLSEVD